MVDGVLERRNLVYCASTRFLFYESFNFDTIFVSDTRNILNWHISSSEIFIVPNIFGSSWFHLIFIQIAFPICFYFSFCYLIFFVYWPLQINGIYDKKIPGLLTIFYNLVAFNPCTQLSNNQHCHFSWIKNLS